MCRENLESVHLVRLLVESRKGELSIKLDCDLPPSDSGSSAWPVDAATSTSWVCSSTGLTPEVEELFFQLAMFPWLFLDHSVGFRVAGVRDGGGSGTSGGLPGEIEVAEQDVSDLDPAG